MFPIRAKDGGYFLARTNRISFTPMGTVDDGVQVSLARLTFNAFRASTMKAAFRVKSS